MRRERKFNLQLYRKVQVEYAKAVRQMVRPGPPKLQWVDHTLPFLNPSDLGDGSR